MKVVYVSMVVLVCKLQILIGSSHESPYACQCSTTECDDNEILKEIDNYSYSCVCLPQYYRNETTQKCELKYRWVNYTPELWNDTRLVHHNSLDKDFIVARLVKANGSKIPYEGYIFIFNKTIKPMPDVSRHSYKRFEILLVEPGYYKWVKLSNGKMVENAIEGGNLGNETVYVCQVYNSEIPYLGRMQYNSHTCYSEFLDQNYSTFNLLTYKI